ncbi:MAG TPA: cytochrome c [Terriglobales bacterium]|jgi:mono/diheme cytochrome c family protein
MHKILRSLLAAAFLAACSLPAQNVPVTVVEGESWLNHLHRTFNETSMGKTGRLGPPPPKPGEEIPHWQPAASVSLVPQTVTLHGADLYRLNCQGCHGESGLGAPPEINSVINPVRATSVALVMARMKTVGMDISRADAEKLAQQSKTALLQRLHNGGQDMPPFPHLDEAEIHSLVAYLKQLADVPGAELQQVAIRESPVRVGEHIVKSTCHTCHSAAGPNPSPEQLLDGAIPPLSTLAARTSQAEFIRKVTHGAPILMGTPPTLYRGRMPVFYYLSEDEAADVYLYLTLNPPSQAANLDTAIALSQQGPAGGGGTPPRQNVLETSLALANRPADAPQPGKRTDVKTVALLSIVASFVALLLAGGLGFTVHEFKRLSAESAGRKLAARDARRRPQHPPLDLTASGQEFKWRVGRSQSQICGL